VLAQTLFLIAMLALLAASAVAGIAGAARAQTVAAAKALIVPGVETGGESHDGARRRSGARCGRGVERAAVP